MATIKLQQFAVQIGISSSKLLQQLAAAGIAEKGVDEILSDQEKEQLLSYLRGGGVAETSNERPKITLSRKSTSSVRQASRTGPSRTVHVEVRKRRTYVRRGELQRQQEEAKKAAEAEEAARQAAEAEKEARAAAEAARAAQEGELEQAAVSEPVATTVVELPLTPPVLPPGDRKAIPKRDEKQKKKKGKEADREKLHVAAGRGGRRKPKRKKATLRVHHLSNLQCDNWWRAPANGPRKYEFKLF